VLGWLTQLSAFTVFLAVGAVGFLFLVVSLVFGELFDHLDIGGDHEAGVDAGAPGLFSTRVLAVFIATFGTTGAIASYYGASVPAASAVATACGALFGGLVLLFARFLYGQQASSEVRAEELEGRAGRVVVAIPAGGVGQVRFRVGEEVLDKLARVADAAPIEENAPVRVVQVEGEIVVVSRSVA
jgi:membrane protein implicated in regulation of membrane protease activity